VIISIYSGLGQTGSVLATLTVPANYKECKCANGNDYCGWNQVHILFSGTAMSVGFSGAANHCAFDNVCFGDSDQKNAIFGNQINMNVLNKNITTGTNKKVKTSLVPNICPSCDEQI